jgi:hypothetical protein
MRFALAFELSNCSFEIHNEFCETKRFVVGNGNISRRLIGDMDFMPLVVKALEGSTHGNNVVVRVRTKNDYFLFGGEGTFRSMCIIGIRFSAGPTSNRML